MRTVIAFAIVSFLSLPTAQAGGYLSLGIGANALLGGDVDSNFDRGSLTVSRVAVGTRIAKFAVEGVLTGSDLKATSDQFLGQSTGDEFSTTSLGVDLRYYIPISGQFEGYVRGGLCKTWLGTGSGTDSTLDYQGRSYVFGGGIQYGFKLPIAGAGVWLTRETRQWTRRHWPSGH